MFKSLKRYAITAVGAAVIAAQAMGPVRSETLPQAVSIPLEFVETIKESPDWLANELRQKALGNDWAIEGGNLVTANLEVIKYVNKIRAFLAMDGFDDEAAFFVLPLVDAKGASGTCVTRFPRDILPKLGVLDFNRDQYEVADLGAEDVRACLANGPSQQPYEGMDRTAFLSNYFVDGGLLDIHRHESLKNDPDFIKKAYDLGLYPYQGGLSGYLQVR